MAKNPVVLSVKLHPVEVLYAICPFCERHMAWRLWADGVSLVSNHCGHVFNAMPLHEGKIFHLTARETDMSNVVTLSVVD